MKVTISMRQFLTDPQMAGAEFSAPSWEGWRAVLIASAGEKLNRSERKSFQRLTGRAKESGRMAECLVAIIGRRGGKSKAAAAFMVWLATCCSWTDDLSLGETGVALLIAPTERQATVTEGYIRALIDGSPLLASLVEERTQHVLKLRGSVAIEVMAANARTIRGVTAIAILMDETAYLPSTEDSAISDTSILEAVRPCVATTQGPILLTSSPATTVGVLHTLWKRHYGPNGSADCVVLQSDSRGMNPRLSQSVVDKAFEENAESASSEFGGMFKEPLSAFLSRQTIEACIETGITERAPLAGVGLIYQCFIDASSGSGTDSFVAAVGHRSRDNDSDVLILDALYESRPPFNPLDIIAALVGHLKRWNISVVTGDSYSANFIVSAFAKHGITYHSSKLSASELYLASMPAFTSRTLVLLDQPRLIDQLVNLRRKIGNAGAESIQHLRGQHDDLSNAVCGLVHLLTPREQAMPTSWEIPGAISVPRFDAYAGVDAQADYYMRRRMEYGPATTSGGRSIHNGVAPVKGSPISNRNAILPGT